MNMFSLMGGQTETNNFSNIRTTLVNKGWIYSIRVPGEVNRLFLFFWHGAFANVQYKSIGHTQMQSLNQQYTSNDAL